MAMDQNYDDMDFRGLQQEAKDRGLNAGGNAEEIKARLLEHDASPEGGPQRGSETIVGDDSDEPAKEPVRAYDERGNVRPADGRYLEDPSDPDSDTTEAGGRAADVADTREDQVPVAPGSAAVMKPDQEEWTDPATQQRLADEAAERTATAQEKQGS